MTIRVFIVSSHTLSLDGLLNLFATRADEIELVGTFLDGLEAFEPGVAPAPDVILLDYEIAGICAEKWLTALQERGLKGQVVLFNAPDDLAAARNCLAGGATGYVLKTDPVAHILEALHAATRDQQWLSPTLGAQAVQMGQKDAAEFPYLKEREWAVLELLAQGLGNQEIATQLALAVSTVKNTVSELYGFLGAANRGELVLMAVELVKELSRRNPKREGGRGKGVA
ncbi:MAG: response regulator transcription factor [Anaerolineales bacterium]